jgi:hypothetical protein
MVEIQLEIFQSKHLASWGTRAGTFTFRASSPHSASTVTAGLESRSCEWIVDPYYYLLASLCFSLFLY